MRNEIIEQVRAASKEASIDEVLRALILDSDVMEVVACLDLITTEEGTRIAMYNWTGMIYPVGPNANLEIPPPPWRVDAKGIKKLIKKDSEIEVLVQDGKEASDQEETTPQYGDHSEGPIDE